MENGLSKVMNIYIHLLEYNNKVDYVLDGLSDKICNELTVRYSEERMEELDIYPDDLPKGFETMVMPPSTAEMWMEVSFAEEQLAALEELKIIYGFKYFEIHINRLIKLAFPNEQTKTKFGRWDDVIKFLKSQGIVTDKIEGMEGVNELRIVNNALKHSSDPYSKLKHIPEFKTKGKRSKQLNSFYERIKGKPGLFVNSISYLIADKLVPPDSI